MVTSGRWHPIKTPIVYCSDHPASALLEVLVHLNVDNGPATFQLLGVSVPDGIEPYTPELPDGWRDELELTQAEGARFINGAAAPLMRVPSVVVPFAWNYLLNPGLLAKAGIAIESVTTHPIDRRLVERLTS